MPKAGKKKQPKPSPYGQKASTKQEEDPLFKATPKNFGVGNKVQPKRDLNRFVKWPKYVRLQRARRILQQRLKSPPAVAQFSRTMDKNSALALFRLLNKYKPEDRKTKHARQLKAAKDKADGKDGGAGSAPVNVKFGINHVTKLIENKEASLVIIAHDVDPIELVVWLPALCVKMDVPFCIVKGKARLGQVVHQKTATCLCLTNVRSEDRADLTKIAEGASASFNEEFGTSMKRGGGNTMGGKSQAATAKKIAIKKREEAKRAKLQ